MKMESLKIMGGPHRMAFKIWEIAWMEGFKNVTFKIWKIAWEAIWRRRLCMQKGLVLKCKPFQVSLPWKTSKQGPYFIKGIIVIELVVFLIFLV